MTKAKTNKAPPPPANKASTLEVTAEPGRSNERTLADAVAAGTLGNAVVMRSFATGTFGELDVTECARALKAGAGAVRAGELSAAESLLSTQAAALNAIFGELARRAALNMGQHLDVTERYMRLALKAQGQCRATLETLAAIKNPPVVFARQANINNGGQQQVNNGVPAPVAIPSDADAVPSSPTGRLANPEGDLPPSGIAGAAGAANVRSAWS